MKHELSLIVINELKMYQWKNMLHRICKIEKLYTKAKKFKLDRPEPVLAFKLLDSSGSSHKDCQLTLTGVNYVESGTLFKQMPVSLKKFFGKQAIPSADNCYFGVSVKVEPVFSSEEV